MPVIKLHSMKCVTLLAFPINVKSLLFVAKSDVLWRRATPLGIWWQISFHFTVSNINRLTKLTGRLSFVVLFFICTYIYYSFFFPDVEFKSQFRLLMQRASCVLTLSFNAVPHSLAEMRGRSVWKTLWSGALNPNGSLGFRAKFGTVSAISECK